MGFRREPKTFLLVFDDPDLAGLEVRARSLSIGELEDDDLQVYESFAAALVSWNLEDEDGNSLPATLETVRSYPDVGFMNALASAWIKAVTGVDDDLGKDSDSGRRYLEESLTMEPLSESLPS